jgi:predicted nucleotidyltransferase
MKSEELNLIRNLLAPIFRQNKTIKAVLFGSASRGSLTKKSDLDLLIIMETQKRFFDRYDEFNEIYSLIKNRAVDLLIYTPEELKNISHRPFIKRILKEGKLIYEH